MKKIFLILSLFLFINNVSAEILPNNINDTVETYKNNSVSLNYTLDVSDSISYFSINFQLSKNNYPYTIITNFRDVNNNTLKIQEKYTLYSVFPFDIVNRNTTLSYNNILISGKNELFDGNNINNSIFNPFETKNSWNRKYKFSGKEIIAQSDLSSRIIIYNLNNNFFPNQINLSSIPTYTDIRIEYKDNGIVVVEASLDDAFNSYNQVFKLIFLGIEGVLKLYNVFTWGSETSLLEMKQTFIGEGSLIYYLNFMLTFILTMIYWIFTMGLLWIFSIVSMILFLYAYVQSKNDMLLCFKLFIDSEISFITTIFINPLMWVYEKFITIWR